HESADSSAGKSAPRIASIITMNERSSVTRTSGMIKREWWLVTPHGRIASNSGCTAVLVDGASTANLPRGASESVIALECHAMRLVGRGFTFDDLEVGMQFRTHRRTIAEADLAAFVNLTWLTEELFTVEDDSERSIKGRAVPGALVYSFAEGLLLPTMQDTGLAFLNATLDIKGPTLVGDTIHVEAEVTEHRLASKGDRGLVRFANKVVNQRGEAVLEYNPLRLLKRK